MALWQAAGTALRIFRTEAARALFAGLAAHSVLPLEAYGSAAFGWVLGIAAHAAGWPIPRGGAQQIADALASYFQTLRGWRTNEYEMCLSGEMRKNGRILFVGH